jgi:3-hydroxyacyl-CoA dehydrogenase
MTDTSPTIDAIDRVAIIGAGTIGASWAALFLARGLSVEVFDPAPDTERTVRDYVTTAWPSLERLGLADRVIRPVSASTAMLRRPQKASSSSRRTCPSGSTSSTRRTG